MTFNMANALDSKPSITLDIAKKMVNNFGDTFGGINGGNNNNHNNNSSGINSNGCSMKKKRHHSSSSSSSTRHKWRHSCYARTSL